MPSTVVFNDTFNWISTGGSANVAVTVTADAPGYEGKFLWNYNVTNTSYFTGEEFETFGVSVEDLSAVTNLGNDMGWTGSVGTNVSWSGSSVIEPGGSGNFWFATLPTVTVLSSAFAGAAVGSVVAPAPALVVTTNLDIRDPKDAWVSLREAVEFVNSPVNLNNHERITFKSTLDGATITLDPGSGMGQLELKKKVHIDGPTNGITIQRDAGSAVKHRIFEVKDTSEAKLTKLTLRNGELDSVAGGAIRSVGNLIVENCTFAQNKAISNLGGAIAATAGSLTITGGGFTGNSASQGGAIYIGQRVATTITGSSITLNNATSAGGGIFIESSTTSTATAVTLSGVDVNGNTATNYGGGIYVSSVATGAGTTLTLTGDTTIRNNVVTSTVGKGGGIYFGAGTIHLAGVTIGDNTANQGDGLYRLAGTGKITTGVVWNNDTEFLEP